MDYAYLVLGIVLLTIFTWVLYKNRKRSGLLHALLRFDTLAGVVAGVYLIVTSVHSLLF